jgi:hypothetical protein
MTYVNAQLLSALKTLLADCEQGAAEAGDTDTTWLDPARAAITEAERSFKHKSLSGEKQ